MSQPRLPGASGALRRVAVALLLLAVAGLPARSPAQDGPGASPPAAPAASPPAADPAPAQTADGVAATDPAAAGSSPGTEVRDLPAGPELDRLIGLLEDETARNEFLTRLKALRAVDQSAGEPHALQFLDRIEKEFDDRITAVVDTAQSVGTSLTALPSLVDWVTFQVTNDFRRQFWARVLTGVGMMLGAGIVLATLLALLVRGPVRRLRPHPDDGLARRVARRAAGFLLDSFPALGFFAAASLVLRIQPLATITVTVGTYAVLAMALFYLLLRVRHHAFDPDDDRRRWAAMDDEQARTTGNWLVRIGGTAIFGHFGLRAADWLGLPASISVVLAHLVFLVIVTMITIWLVRSQAAIQRFVRNIAQAAMDLPLLKAVIPWESLANSGYLLLLLLVWAHYAVWALGIDGGFSYLLVATVATVLIFVLLQMALIGLDRLRARWVPEVRVEEGMEPAEPVRAARTGLALGLATQLLRLLAIVAVLQAWGVDILSWISSATGQVFIERLMRIGIVALGALLVWLALSRWIRGYIEARDAGGNLIHSNRSRTLANIGRNLLLVGIFLFAGATILSQIGVDTAPLIAGAGVVGLAIGFGAQRLVQDIITGLFILLGDTMRVGDVVNLGGRGGSVEGMSVRAVTLRDYSGAVHTIPYSSIDVVTNLTKDFAYWVFNLSVAYKESVDQVIQVLREIDEQIRKEWPYRRLILEPLEVAGLDKFGPSEVIVTARIKTRPGDQWRVGREMQRRIKLEFERRGIEIPYPHQTVYFGTDKAGHAPALHIARDRPVGAPASSGHGEVDRQDQPRRMAGR